MKRVIDRKDEELNGLTDATQRAAAKAQVNENSPRIIPCHWWVLEGADPVRLPPIPSHDLPELGRTGLSSEELEEETKLVKIAGIDNCVIGLTNKGHLLRYDRLSGEEAYQQGRWEYVSDKACLKTENSYRSQLPYFSDIEKLQEHAVYRAVDGNDAPQLTSPETMHINHVRSFNSIT